MNLLALDCSTEACSVALYRNTSRAACIEGQVIAEDFQLASREHTQRLLPMVEQVLAASETSLSQLDAIAFGRGPGSFTGLRIALGAVQGMAFGADLPVLPVSTLAGLAQTALENSVLSRQPCDQLIAAIDARMDEVYWASYRIEDGLATVDGDEHLSAPAVLSAAIQPASRTVGAGSGWRCVDHAGPSQQLILQLPDCLPRAGAIARLGDREARLGHFCRADQALPVYLRDEVAWQKNTDQSLNCK